ncbi:hypothetical protein DH2020_041864 [Rehmannia glutinosa]|uniref:GDSL esterase/lipase n=1 Tax=Rehmannia glutinosa TaxID=99300 RepID=A0ABR0UPI3_REHGL
MPIGGGGGCSGGGGDGQPWAVRRWVAVLIQRASMWWSLSSSFPPVSVLFLLHFLLLILFAHIAETRNSSIPAFFVFGDSTVDSGNNNYIKTISKSNFPPYGKDFPNHIPTGRFTNGRLVTDFLASDVGIKDYIPPYLDPTLSLDDLETGGLLKLGARKIAFVGLPPIGCVPAVITLNSDNALINRGCIERLSSVARDYNRLLQSKLTAMQTHGANIIYVDIYTSVEEMIKKPQQFGFEEVNCGCCGSGIIEASILCNPYSLVCSDDSKYVFWDSVHPTEAAYYKVFKDLRSIVDKFSKD